MRSSPFSAVTQIKLSSWRGPKGRQRVGDREPCLLGQVVGERLARPSCFTFQLLESGPMGPSLAAAGPEIALMHKAVGQDQSHSATICHLTLANLDQRGLSSLHPNITRTRICGSGEIHADSGQSWGSFLLLLGEGH